MSEEDETNFLNSKICYLCNKNFSIEDLRRDHDHLKKYNNYRGALCNTCNINYNLNNTKLPVLIHNLKGYDANFIIKKYC